jgi:hypothetical protein
VLPYWDSHSLSNYPRIAIGRVGPYSCCIVSSERTVLSIFHNHKAALLFNHNEQTDLFLHKTLQDKIRLNRVSLQLFIDFKDDCWISNLFKFHPSDDMFSQSSFWFLLAKTFSKICRAGARDWSDRRKVSHMSQVIFFPTADEHVVLFCEQDLNKLLIKRET